MKQRLFTFLLLAFAGLTACNKNNDNQPDIKQYDDMQIQAYMTANSLTGFTKDETQLGDGASGMYYKIINQGSGDTLKYSDRISIVYSVKSMDGKYNSVDTIANHIDDYLGHFVNSNLPRGLQLAVHDLLKYKGGSMRVLIPSRLAYGVKGFGTGSITNSQRIAGNQSLDYYVYVIKDQKPYDDLLINNYMSANNLSGYTKDASGYWYKINTAATGAVGEITNYSNVSLTYTGALLNGVFFDQTAKTSATTLVPNNLIDGFKNALVNRSATGTSMSLLVPAYLGYGREIQNTIPANSPLLFEIQVASVTQP